MQKNSDIAGNYYRAANEAYVYDYYPEYNNFRGSAIEVNGSGITGTIQLTGYYIVSAKGNYMYQTTTGVYVNLADESGWQFVQGGSVPQYSAYKAQSLVNEIITNNQTIIANNCLCARFAYKLTNEQKRELYALQTRLKNRNAQLLDNNLISSETQASPAGYNLLEQYLTDFMQDDSYMGVGVVVSTTVVIVVSAIVVAAMGTAAYYAFKYYAEESRQDVKFSNSLTKTLTEKLTEEEYQQLVKETQGMVTKASVLSRLSSGSKQWLILAGAGAIAFGVYKFLNRKKQ